MTGLEPKPSADLDWLKNFNCEKHALEVARQFQSLDSSDTVWLEAIGRTDRVIDQAWMKQMSRAAIVGSINLNQDLEITKESEIRGSRKRFYEYYLGWNKEEHFVASTYTRLLERKQGTPPIPLRLIENQRLVVSYSINPATVMHTGVIMLTQSKDTLKSKIDSLSQIHPRVDSLVNGNPRLLGTNIRSSKAKAELLTASGIDVCTQPPGILAGVLGLNEKELQSRITTLQSIGRLSASRIYNYRE